MLELFYDDVIFISFLGLAYSFSYFIGAQIDSLMWHLKKNAGNFSIANSLFILNNFLWNNISYLNFFL